MRLRQLRHAAGLCVGLLIFDLARADDLRPAQLGPIRQKLADSIRWSLPDRCSLEALAQVWAGDDALRCASVGCLLEAQSRAIAAYLLLGDSIALVNARGARVLTMLGSGWLPVVGRSPAAPESVAFSVRTCTRFARGGQKESPPSCVDEKLVTAPDRRPRWRCTGPTAPETLPPERRHEKSALPLAPEARHGGLISDFRIPVHLLSEGAWSVTTADVRRTAIEPPVHVHSFGKVLLHVDSGNVEVELDGNELLDLGRDEWVYLPAGMAHRVAILDDARVTLHVSGGEACPELQARTASFPAEREATPPWVREPARLGRSECDRSSLGRSWAGEGAIDCGTVGTTKKDPAYRCAMWAQEHRRSFFLVEDLQGIDSSVSRVIVRTTDGESFEIMLSGYDSYSGVDWKACERFEGPSWRGRALLSRAITCVPLAIDHAAIDRVTGRLGPWSCARGKFPPGLPNRARMASEFLGAPEASGFAWPSAAIETLGRGTLDFKVIQSGDEAGCLAPRELTDGPEVWLLSNRWGARYPTWISIPERAERTYPLRMRDQDTPAVVYRAHSERPWPNMFGPCPVIIRTPGTFH